MSALDTVLDALRCPVCADRMRLDVARLACPAGHSFDVARQGYVHLSTGRRGPGTDDTAAMVAARADFLGRGHLATVTSAIVAAAAGADGLVLDLAGGTGHHLTAVLDAAPAARGLCLDLSAAALRRAARAHPRAAAIGADAWQRLPLADASVDVVLSVFGPRDPAELTRVLRPGGRLVVASPAPDHLHELIAPMGMLAVDPDKQARHADTFAAFARVGVERVGGVRPLGRDDVVAAVEMGPAASHVDADAIAARAAALPDPVTVTVAVDVATYARP